MSGLPSDHVRSRSTLWECCELMDLTTTRFKPYKTQSSCPNCYMRRPLGMDLPAKKTVIESIHSWRNHQNPHSLLLIKPHSPRCVKNLMTKCSKKSVDEHHVLHHLLPPVSVTGHNLRRRTHSFVLPAKCETVWNCLAGQKFLQMSTL